MSKTDVREYAEGYPVTIEPYAEYALYGGAPIHPEAHGRLVVIATNEGGYNGVQIDLVDLLEWLAEYRRDLLVEALRESPADTKGDVSEHVRQR